MNSQPFYCPHKTFKKGDSKFKCLKTPNEASMKDSRDIIHYKYFKLRESLNYESLDWIIQLL